MTIKNYANYIVILNEAQRSEGSYVIGVRQLRIYLHYTGGRRKNLISNASKHLAL